MTTATIVAATEEGRVVYSNIRRFIKYILGSNIGEVLTIAAAPILLGSGGIPLTPLQILWMNLVTDGLPALAGSRAAGLNVMRRPPKRECMRAWGYMVRIGIIFAIVTIVMMEIVYFRNDFGAEPEVLEDHGVYHSVWRRWVTPSRSLRYSAHTGDEFFLQPLLLAAVTVTSLLQLALIYGATACFFGTHWLSPLQLAICIGFSALIFVWIEGEKLFIRLVQAWRSR